MNISNQIKVNLEQRRSIHEEDDFGLVVEEKYIRVNLECNHLGKVSKSSVVR